MQTLGLQNHPRYSRYACYQYEQNYKLVGIANQAGITHRYCGEEESHQLTDWMCRQFSAASAAISRVYSLRYHLTVSLIQE